MGAEHDFKKVKLFSGVIYHQPEMYAACKKKLEGIFSTIDIETEEIKFDFTTYYHKEMGKPLFRRFISFEALISPEELPDIKHFTNKMEIETAIDGNRTINIDPGFVSDANVIIATTKNYYHRVPLTNGIYAHMEYVIIKRKLVTLDWTYPDFKSQPYMHFFDNMIAVYKQQLYPDEE